VYGEGIELSQAVPTGAALSMARPSAIAPLRSSAPYPLAAGDPDG
jgi:hypothetical protein